MSSGLFVAVILRRTGLYTVLISNLCQHDGQEYASEEYSSKRCLDKIKGAKGQREY